MKVSLAGNLHNRRADTAYDMRLVNCYPETVTNPVTGEKRAYVIKRPGLAQYSAPAGAVAGRGVFYWGQTGKVYSVFGNTVYANTASLGTITTSTGMCTIEATAGATPRLVITDGTKGYTVSTSDVLTEITDVDFPTSLVPGIAYLDQYTFVMKSNGEIYNSDLANPTSWVSSNYITAENSPDKGVALAKQKNQVIAFGEYSTELFYDAANATGSPLLRTEGAILQIGLAGKWTVTPFPIKERLAWVAQTRNGGRSVYMLAGFEPSIISNGSVDRLLEAEGANIVNAVGYGVEVGGATFYFLRLTNTTIACNLGEKAWFEVQSGSSTFAGVAATDINGTYVIQGASDGKLHTIAQTNYQDTGSTAINVKIVTDMMDFGAPGLWKFCDRLGLHGEKASVTSNVSIRQTDDDYQTWSTARTIDMSLVTPEIYRMGSFKRRAFELTHSANTALLLEALDLDLDIEGRRPEKNGEQ